MRKNPPPDDPDEMFRFIPPTAMETPNAQWSIFRGAYVADMMTGFYGGFKFEVHDGITHYYAAPENPPPFPVVETGHENAQYFERYSNGHVECYPLSSAGLRGSLIGSSCSAGVLRVKRYVICC